MSFRIRETIQRTRVCHDIEVKSCFDMPLLVRFYGVPFRSTVQMFPTTNCLISLAEYVSIVNLVTMVSGTLN